MPKEITIGDVISISDNKTHCDYVKELEPENEHLRKYVKFLESRYCNPAVECSKKAGFKINSIGVDYENSN